MNFSSQAIPCLIALLALGACGRTTDSATGGAAGAGGAVSGMGGTPEQGAGGEGTGGTTLDPSCSLESIEDGSLRAAVREVLELSADDEADAALLATVRTLLTENVASLVGIECLPELVVLALDDSTVSDLSPLAGNPRLSQLSVSANVELVDLQSLTSHENLSRLYLRDVAVVDLSPVSGMSRLRDLDVRGAPVADLNGVGAAGALTRLYLEDTVVSDLTPLAESSTLYNVLVKTSAVTSLAPLLNWNVTPGFLNVVGNPLSQAAIEQEIPDLVDAGWCVISGPSEAEQTDSPTGCASSKV